MAALLDNASALICCEDKILLFHRDDKPTIPAPDCWHLPGGGIEPGETPEQGMRRELSEEVTYVPKNLKLLLTLSNSDGHTTYVFFTKVSQEEAMLFKKGPDEGQEIAFFTLVEAEQLKLSPGFRNKLTENRPMIENLLSTT